jgi:hypothetical protein
LIEVKDGRKVPSARKLTPMEAAWIARWRGRVAVVACVVDALAVLGVRGFAAAPVPPWEPEADDYARPAR